MTHEAGIWIFGIITLVCLSIWLLCRRSKAVEDAVESVPFHYTQAYDAAQTIDEDLVWDDSNCSGWYSALPIVEAEKPKPLPKGWQGWEGGEQPVPDETMVVVMLRSGHISPIDLASVWGWDHALGRAWSGYDIVAWRVA